MKLGELSEEKIEKILRGGKGLRKDGKKRVRRAPINQRLLRQIERLAKKKRYHLAYVKQRYHRLKAAKLAGQQAESAKIGGEKKRQESNG